MKNLFIVVIALLMSIGVNAQHKITSPHPDLSIKVSRCVEANGTVILDLMITNLGNEEEIRFWGNATSPGTIAYDDEGNIYDSTISVGSPSKSLSGNRTYIVFPTDVPIKFRIQIDKVDPNATKIAVLKLKTSSSGAMGLDQNKHVIQLQNIEFERK